MRGRRRGRRRGRGGSAGGLIGTQRTPGRNKGSLLRQTVINEDLKLLRLQLARECVGLGFGPPLKPSLRKSSDKQPPADAVEADDSEGRAATISKDEKGSVVDFSAELIAAQADQPIESVTEIGGLISEQDFQLRCDLNHRDEPRRKSAHRAFKAAASSGGRVRVSRAPSGRSICKR